MSPKSRSLPEWPKTKSESSGTSTYNLLRYKRKKASKRQRTVQKTAYPGKICHRNWGMNSGGPKSAWKYKELRKLLVRHRFCLVYHGLCMSIYITITKVPLAADNM